jgi:predicted Zn-dependent protease
LHSASVVRRWLTAVLVALVLALPACATQQTLIQTTPGAPTKVIVPPNSYSPAQDVQIGQQAAAQARKELPILSDELLTSYVASIGRRLVAAIPAELQHPEFRYSFEVVNAKEINAFALPGGPMFVNRGMLGAATDEGEIAGVMAHELSHVILRHGTAQASKATPYQVGEIAGQVLGAIVGGQLGGLIAQGSQFGISMAFMRFSREYEQQADIEGSHVMARANYDPQDMAMMFKMLEEQGGSGAPEWLSDHPDPGNRYNYISAEAKTLHVSNPIRDTPQFHTMQAHLKELPPAPPPRAATQ